VNRPNRGALLLVAVFALAGTVFAAFSSFDYIAHLDRQVHAITCSFVPGLAAPDSSGASGCHVVMMSPYSAVLRSWTWGGIPISLPAFAVFAFLLYGALDLLFRGAGRNPDETRFLFVATLLPLLVSAAYFAISLLVLHTVCKVCIGVYLSSLGVFLAAWSAHHRAVWQPRPPGFRSHAWGVFAFRFLEGVAFVALPVFFYLAFKPAYAAGTTDCGDLLHPEDRYGVRVKLTAPPGGVPAIELLDPLCPACKGLSERLAAGGFDRSLALEAVLFPLDKECNWMVSESVHPGACVVAEAVLCADSGAGDVLDWAFANQEELRDYGAGNPTRLTNLVKLQFPGLAGCLGTPAVRARLNRSLRWAVSNSLPVLTPQLFVRAHKLCDEDTDLGLDYVLPRLLARESGGGARTEGRR
jgi:uncharacterized membrane protein